jgi:uncharacterized protein (UPF0548 family)
MTLFSIGEPPEERILGFLRAQQEAPLSYEHVGASKSGAPELAGYAVDHNRVRLGQGRDTLDRAVAALHAWKMFDIGWARLVPEDAPIEVGTSVAVLARHYGFLSLNPCRILYTIEDNDGGCVRRGFAYGTLPGHGERGEERFTLEWRRDNDSVFYDLYAFSRPNHVLAKLGYPMARRLQHRFAKDSLQAMVRATGSR